MAMVIAKIIAEILGMDHIDTQVVGGRVIYKYKSTGILSSAGIQELKAKIFSLLDFPADIPVDVRITPVKRGAIFKEYIVEIEVPQERFRAEHRKYLRLKHRLTDRL
jgi:hypothetical protein